MSAMRTSLRALRPVLSSFGNSQQMQRRLASCVAAKLDSIVTELPLKDAFLFTKHDRKWTREDVRKQSQALASGLIDSGCKPGDGIAVWLPDYAEKVRTVWS
jgi:acyl-CoA synthetase (AMP-forming)/AMP-acid ligase II